MSYDLTSYLLRDGLSSELATFTLSLNKAVTRCLTDVLEGLAAHVLGINDSVKLLLIGLYPHCVAAKVLDVNGICPGLSVCTLEGILTDPDAVGIT